MAYASDTQGIQDLLAAYDLGAGSVPDATALTRLQAQATAEVNAIIQGEGVECFGLDSVSTGMAEVLENLMAAREAANAGTFQGREGATRQLDRRIINATARLRSAARTSTSTRLGRQAGFRVGQITTRADRVRPKTLTG